MPNRWDETWHRLQAWTNGSAQSERLAAQILLEERYSSVDPSRPLGGPDGGKDALITKDGVPLIMAVHFPRGQKTFAATKKKLVNDLAGVKKNKAMGMVFVCNQELTMAERKQLARAAKGQLAELFHVDRITTILDKPSMAGVRKQFLGIDDEEAPTLIVGGLGGSAPGAGGGGGGVIGDGRGGDGGPGGDVVLHGQPATAPGAGGGGGGAFSPGQVGGTGGGGGEVVSRVVRVEPGKTYEVRIGHGGAASNPGEDGQDGGDTSFGDLLVARGGRGGRTPRPSWPPPVGTISVASTSEPRVARGLRVALLLADCVHVKNDLLYALGAGWEYCAVPTLPFQMVWPVGLVVGVGADLPQVELEIAAIDPHGNVISRAQVHVHRSDARPVAIATLQFGLSVMLSTAGVFTVSVLLGAEEIASHELEVRLDH